MVVDWGWFEERRFQRPVLEGVAASGGAGEGSPAGAV